jgi:tetratricopeptide (TPR) repeat protein
VRASSVAGSETAPRRTGAAIALIATLALAAFAQTIPYEFVWDDISLIQDSRFYDSASLGDVWSHSYWQTPPGERPQHRTLYYRPVVSTSYWLNWHVADGASWPFHLTNVLLHACCSVLVLLAGRRLLGDELLAVLAAALYALHPVHVEAVAFVSGRSDLWVTLFMLAAIWVLDDGPRDRVRGVLGCAMMLGAALSKEVGFLAPALWLIWCRGRTGEPWTHIVRGRIGWLVGQALLLGALLALRVALFRGLVGNANGSGLIYSGAERVGLVWLTFGDYLTKLVWPLPHAAYLTLDRVDLAPSLHMLAATGAVVAFAAIVWLGRRLPGVLVGAAWILVTLFPVMNFVPIPSSYLSERQLYLPSVGFVWLLAALASNLTATRRRGLVAVSAALCLLATADVIDRSRTWSDPETFLSQVIVDSPGEVLGYNNLASHYLDVGQPDQAIAMAEKALSLAPELAPAWSSLGQGLSEKGMSQPALLALQRAASIEPDRPHHQLILATIANRAGQPELASMAANRFVTLAPGAIQGWNELAMARGALGDFDGAARAAQRAIALDPDYAPALINLGSAELFRGDLPAAERAFRAALQREPSAAVAVANLARALHARGESADADAVLSTWLARFPSSPARAMVEAVREEIHAAP